MKSVKKYAEIDKGSLVTLSYSGKENVLRKRKLLKDEQLLEMDVNLVSGIAKNVLVHDAALKRKGIAEHIKGDSSFSSIEDGLEVFRYIIAPSESRIFFEEFWEKRPCAIQRNSKNYFSSLISFEGIDKMLREEYVEYTTHIDITEYTDGVRSTLNPDGRALPTAVWDYYSCGCSVRLLNPQKFFPAIHDMNAKLQEYFHCMVGANVYLTPPDSQGFAPHYDDIEAFVLQIEGEKYWKLYNPISEAEHLPRSSSRNFQESEIGNPILEVILKPGDVLYFPRGMIHQASTVTGKHSLHITLSFYQRQSYADLFEILVPMMLSKAIQENVELRSGLPLNIWKCFGTIHSKNMNKERVNVQNKIQNLLEKVFEQEKIDDAVDEMAKRFQYDALPPIITSNEKPLTVFGVETIVNRNGEYKQKQKINKNSNVKLIRGNIFRLVSEDGTFRVYYYLDNSMSYHEYESNYLEVDETGKKIVEFLIKQYPSYSTVSSLPGKEFQKCSIVHDLWGRGLIFLKI